MIKLQSSHLYFLIAVLAGGLLPLAFAPFQFYPLAIIAPAILLFIWQKSLPLQAFWRGLAFGIGFFGVGVSWVFVSIHEFGNTSTPIALFITALFVVYLALFPATQGYLLTRFLTRPTFSKFCLAFPASWVLFEWFRGWFLTGLPWLFLGATQVASPLRGLVPLLGEYGVAFAVTFSSGLIIWAIYKYYAAKKLGASISILLLVFIWCTTPLLAHIDWTEPQGQPIKVALIQGNIPQQLKWDPTYLQTTIQRYYDLTQLHWDSQIIVWPEAAIPTLLQNTKDFLNIMDTQAKQHHATLITGIPIQNGFDYYNGIVVLGNDSGLYYKRHLVPFGEYVPLGSILRGLIGFFDIPMSNFSPGPLQQNALHVQGLVIAPFVCYEIIYSKMVLSLLPQANLLLTISDDAWFGHSFASAQHLQMGQFRALETGRYHLFSSNNGLTAIITPQGTIQASIPPFQSLTLTGTVQKRIGATPFVRLGTTPILAFMIFLVGLAVWLEKKHKKISLNTVSKFSYV